MNKINKDNSLPNKYKVKRSPFSYWGCKRLDYKKIHPYFDFSKNIMIDLFGGSGTVLINLKELKVYEKYIYNDKWITIYNLLINIQNEKKKNKLINYFNNVPISLEELKRHDFDNKIDIEDYYKFLYIKHYGFRGVSTHTITIKNNQVPKRRNYDKMINEYHNILQDVTILNLDFKILLEKYKYISECFIYMDPPYVSKSQSFKGYQEAFSVVECVYILEFLKDPTIKCSIMINIDFSGFVYMNYGKYIKHIYPKKYTGCSKENNYLCRYQCILTNY